MQLSPAKGELCNPSSSPALWYKDMYWNKKQRKGLVNKLSLEDLNPLLLPCYTDDQKKAMKLKGTMKKKKLSFALANSVTKSNYLHIFKSWTDHIHLKTGNPTFLPDQPHSGAGERKEIVPMESGEAELPVSSATCTTRSQLLLQRMQESFHFLCRHLCG